MPKTYIALMRATGRNGGVPRYSAHPYSGDTDFPTITSIKGIGTGNGHLPDQQEFWIEEWEYPPIGLYFADCPSGGHDLLALDYSECGKKGEPKVVHVDQEGDFEVTPVAENFQSFIQALVVPEEE